jgi:hypothetical protein
MTCTHKPFSEMDNWETFCWAIKKPRFARREGAVRVPRLTIEHVPQSR